MSCFDGAFFGWRPEEAEPQDAGEKQAVRRRWRGEGNEIV
jgi:hypothetical protein